MRMRFLIILKEKSGASLMFVLGIMLLLMAISVSALVAASANAGSALKQKEYSQMMILDDSIHKNILYALQRERTYAEDMDDLLSTQLAYAVYEANDPDSSGYDPAIKRLGDMTLDIGISAAAAVTVPDLYDGSIKVKSITLSFPEQNVLITPPLPAIYIYDEAGTGSPPRTLDSPREPKIAKVDATMVVTVEINAKGKIVTTRAIYKYTGGKLSDDPDGNHDGEDEDIDPPLPMGFTADGYGEWRLVKHENVDAVSTTG